MATRSHVTFRSGDTDCAGYLVRLAESQGARLPCLVMGHGFGGTMDRLFATADAFAEAGFAALVFDYRGFGESGGEPRQVVDLAGQREDFRAAIHFARSCAGIDPERIVLWGNSLGGGHVIAVAADDPHIAAVISQIPFNGFPAKVEGRTGRETLRLLAAILWDAIRGWLGRPPFLIPLVGAPGEVAITTEADARAHVATLPEGSLWRNEAAPRTLLGMMSYRPGDESHRLGMPLLVCIADADRETPEEKTRPIAERAPRGELRRYAGNHFDFYRDTNLRRQALADQIAFLRKHVSEGRRLA
jgi:quorum-quenching protein AidA